VKSFFFTVVCFLSFFVFFIGISYAYQKDTVYFEDSFSSVNDSVWDIKNSGGQIQIQDGLNLISENSKYFPFLSSKINIFPQTGDFYIKIRFKYLELTGLGVGFGFGNLVPQYGTTNFPFKDSDLVKFQVWQSNNNYLYIETYKCSSNDVCESSRTRVYTSNSPDLLYHTIFVNNISGVTSVYIDGQKTNSSPIIGTNWRPSVFWAGHIVQLSSINDWTDIKLYSIETGSIIDSPVQIKTIIIPGLGASWDIGAILTGNTEGNWQIPSFVSQYDGLINSFINAGYTKNTDLFVFPYDWRKPLSVLADRLKFFIDNNIPSGEKVNIVGHSMGGLVARAYTHQYGDSRINKSIIIGSPNKGALKAYGVWEGATVWDGSWWTKLALDLTTHFGANPDESKVKTIQRLSPSIKDLLPVYNFLEYNGSLVPWTTLIQKNDYLDHLNLFGSLYNNQTNTIYSADVTTDNILKIAYPLPEDQDFWQDGKPISINPFVATTGDGTVTEESARGVFTNNVAANGWHDELVTKKENVEKIFDLLEIDITKAINGINDTRNNTFVVSLQSPGKLEVCDADKIKCNEELGIYISDNKLFLLPGYNNENLVIKIIEEGVKGDYNLHLGNINSFSNWKIVSGNLNSDNQIDFYQVASDGQNITADLIDTIAPISPTITGFKNPELNCGTTTNLHSITVDWTDSTDNRGVVGYEYNIDYPLGNNRGEWNSFFVNSEYTGSLNEGIHYIKVRAKDATGNLSAWSNVCSITADWTAPIVTITSPISGIYFQNTLPDLLFNAIDNLDTDLTINSISLPKSIGQHTITITATDDAGNIGSASVTYSIQGPVADKNQCKKNGWKLFELFKFKNQGDCVSYYEKFEKIEYFFNKFSSFFNRR